MSFAQTLTFDTTSHFTYDTTQVVISGGVATLVNVPPYSVLNPTITTQHRTMMSALTGFSEVKSVSGSDSVQYQLLVNNLAYWYSGTTWTLADGTYATSNTATTINAQASNLVSQLGLSGIFYVQVRAFLHSASGSSTPTLTSVTLNYGFAYGTATVISQNLVYAYLTDLLGQVPYSSAAPSTLYVKNGRMFMHGNHVIAPFTKSVVFDSTGYAQLSVIETATPGEKLEFLLTYYDKNSLRTVWINPAVVPNLGTSALTSFTSVSALDFG